MTTDAELLPRSVDHLLDALRTVRPCALARPTPCPLWTLELLLQHLAGSLETFTGAVCRGVVDPRGRAPDPGVPTVARVAWAALRLRAVHTRTGLDEGLLVVADHHPPLPMPLLVLTAALEVTAHAWDIGRATGAARPIPEDLAAALLPVAERLVTAAERPSLFGLALPHPPGGRSGDRLLAVLGRGDPAMIA